MTTSDEPRIPFMPVKGKPALHLREWTPEEKAMFLKLKLDMEWRAKRMEEMRNGNVQGPDAGADEGGKD